MSRTSKKLVEALKDITSCDTPFQLCTVKSVDEDNWTCICEDLEGNELLDVRLRANIDGTDGYIIVPDLESSVIVGHVSKTAHYVAMTSRVDKIIINDGVNGGLIKINELTTQLQKLTARVDGIIEAINNGAAVPQDGGSALHTSIKSALAGLTDKEDFTNLENDKVLH